MSRVEKDPPFDVNITRCKGRIGVLTGGGDVPGLNPAIRAVVLRAEDAGYEVVGIKRGWAGAVDIIPQDVDNSDNFQVLTREIVDKAGRTGGTFLHTSRTNPANMSKEDIPEHLRCKYSSEGKQDLTSEVLKNLDWLGIEHLIAVGGDDTLSYAVRLAKEGVSVIGIPKTMDGDVPGTDYCIGFDTCINRTIELVNSLRTSAGSHERFLVSEVLGRHAGFTATVPTLAGAADRCVIPEYPFIAEQLVQLMSDDRRRNSSRYSVVLVSEGAKFVDGDMVYQHAGTDAYGHRKLGGIGDLVSAKLEELSPQFNNGKKVGVINQRLGYLVRSGNPAGFDMIVPTVYGNLALDLILGKCPNMLVGVMDGRYGYESIEVVTSGTKTVDIERDYDPVRLRPSFKNFLNRPMSLI